MGHSVDMHKMAYRFHNATTELGKVGKVFQLLDSISSDKIEKLKNLKGKS